MPTRHGPLLWIASAIGCLSAGCGAGIDRRVGELHMHQYPSGGHITPLFIDPATPMAKVVFDSALPEARPATRKVDDCSVYVVAPCDNACAAAPSPIDGGTIRVTGLARPVSTMFHPELGGYYDDVAFVDDFLVGGAVVQVQAEGSARIPAFTSTLKLPMPIAPTSTLDHGLASGLTVSWATSGDDTRVRIDLVVTPAVGEAVDVVCDVADAAQRFALPDQARALLPPAPRQLQLEVSRYRLVDVSLGDGRGVVVHGGYAVPAAASEP